jgi:hypothetical protein
MCLTKTTQTTQTTQTTHPTHPNPFSSVVVHKKGNAPSSTTKAFVVTGKLLLMATMIAGLAAVCIFCPPVAGIFAITFVAGWIATGAAISTFLGLCSLACELKENEWPGNLGNMFRYTDHNGKDCAIFLLSSIGLPFIPFCCCLWTAAACK